MIRRCFTVVTVAIGLTVPVGVKSDGDGRLAVAPNDASADGLCTTHPTKFCNGIQGKQKIPQ